MLKFQSAGLGYRRDLADGFLSWQDNSIINFIEVSPENWLKMGGQARYHFDKVAEKIPVIIHGLSLSLGGQSPFCQEHACFEPHLLALMDFENAQLLTEVAMATVPAEFEWDNDSVMQFSGTAELRQYNVDFLASEFAIYYNRLDELDLFLLTTLKEQANSLNGLLAELVEFIDSNPQFFVTLRERWQKWIELEVVYPL